MAAGIEAAGKTGLRFPKAEDRRVCGRLLLAWLSEARDLAEKPGGVLAEENHRQQGS